MKEMRSAITACLGPNALPFTITTFPLLGIQSDVSASLTVSAALLVASSHYRAAQHNITTRRWGAIPPITVPLFIDRNTFTSSLPSFIAPSTTGNRANITFNPDEMLLGATQCCIQCTIQAPSAEAALRLHDALSPLGPVMLALSAATPIYRGYLADTDVRWNTLGQLVDDRTEDERRVLGRPLLVCPRAFMGTLRSSSGGKGEKIKERGALGEEEQADPNVPPNVNFQLMHNGFFPHVKLKHPTGKGEGWRVEFRPMEVQLSDFENAAYVMFVVLVARAMERFGVDYRVPLGRVWENFDRAHPRDAVRWQRFWWAVEDDGAGGRKSPEGLMNGVGGKQNVALLTVDEIINGCQSFRGIMALVRDYMKEEGFTSKEREQLQPYLDLSPEYAGDSQISDGICFDLLQKIKGIMAGERDGGLFG
ncbi:glutamate--cysteine ligase [Botryosphaeria dothidea]